MTPKVYCTACLNLKIDRPFMSVIQPNYITGEQDGSILTKRFICTAGEQEKPCMANAHGECPDFIPDTLDCDGDR